MRILVTGSAGHLGEALMRTFKASGTDAIGLDIKPTLYVLHTATLHKPHIATHARQDFLDTNLAGTLNLLEESLLSRIKAFIFTSTTSVFGRALTPVRGECRCARSA
jgi:nucleoside-diphosphate-sugar epimerase